MREFLIKFLTFFQANRKVILVIIAAALFVLFGLWSRTQFSVGVFQPFAAEETPELPPLPNGATPRLLPLSE